MEKHLAEGDVEKAFRNPKKGAVPSESQRLAAPMAQGTLMWRSLYRKWVNGWLKTAERTMEDDQ